MSLLICADCGSPMVLRNSRYGKFYGCSRYPECRGTHGAHPDGSPLGAPADAPTKAARTRAHAAFDQLWKGGHMQRGRAYAWMRRVMQLGKDDAHIGRFTIEQCDQLVGFVDAELRLIAAGLGEIGG